jgi:D-alanyl-D-alanine carboxypeptidase
VTSAVIDSATLDTALDAVLERHGPGLHGLVTENGEVVYQRSVGVADLDSGRAIEPGEFFRIGSVTKVYVAALVLRLAQDGVLALTDTVQRWLGDIVPGGDVMTVEVLLRLRSGLPDYVEPLFGTPPDISLAGHYWTPQHLIRVALAAPDRWDPDTAYRYSNTDFILLGLIVEAATGERLDAQMQQRIFEPLGLRDTILPAVDPVIRPPHPTGHLRFGADQGYLPSPDVSPSEAWTSGAIVATPRDLAAFFDRLIGGTVLAPEWLARMLDGTQVIDEHRKRGLGIVRFEFQPGRVAYGHQGGVPGYTSVVARSTNGRCVVIYQNGIDMQAALSSDNEFTQAGLAL